VQDNKISINQSPWAWGSKTLKAEQHIFEKCLQNKRCSAGCILTRAVLGTSLKKNQRKTIGEDKNFFLKIFISLSL